MTCVLFQTGTQMLFKNGSIDSLACLVFGINTSYDLLPRNCSKYAICSVFLIQVGVKRGEQFSMMC